MIASGQNLKRLLQKHGWGRRTCPAQAIFAFFLALSWWFTRLDLTDRSISLVIGLHDSLSQRMNISLSC
jgi:ABC-type phosphate/phosphonate transport system permease subunit